MIQTGSPLARKELRSLSLIASRVSSSLDLDTVLAVALSEVIAHIRVDGAAICLFQRPNGELRTVAALGLRADSVDMHNSHLAARGESVCEGVAGDLLQRQVPSVMCLDEECALLQAGFRSVAAAPLLAGQELIGCLIVLTRRPRAFGPKDIALAAEVGRQVGNAVANAARYSESQRALARIADEAAVLQTIIDSAEDGIVLVDEQMRVLVFSPGAERITGWQASDALGRSCCEVLGWSCASNGEVRCPFANLDEGLAPRGYLEGRALFKDGREKWLGVSVARVKGQGAEMDRSVLIARDITAARSLEEDRRGLVTVVSHELRTPLTSIRALGELLAEHDFGPGQIKEMASSINQESVRMSELVDNLLSAARIEAGAVTCSPGPVDSARVVNESIAGLQGGVGANHRFVVEFPASMPRVWADRDLLRVIVDNLLSNAVKYSTAPSAVLVKGQAVDGYVRISVVDEGRGMAAEERARVFERFYRARHLGSAPVAGVGLGLYIVKSLVELQGGRVQVESVPGSGSTFTFSVPVENGAARATS